jgi:hypothetical protein
VTDILKAFLDRAGLQAEDLHRAEVEKIAESVECDDTDGFIEATAEVCGLSWKLGKRPEGWLELHSDKWSLDLASRANRDSLTLVVLAALLVREGMADATISWVARVLPAVINLNASSVTSEDGLLTVRLAVKPCELPTHLHETVNPLDFADFSGSIARAAVGDSLVIHS